MTIYNKLNLTLTLYIQIDSFQFSNSKVDQHVLAGKGREFKTLGITVNRKKTITEKNLSSKTRKLIDSDDCAFIASDDNLWLRWKCKDKSSSVSKSVLLRSEPRYGKFYSLLLLFWAKILIEKLKTVMKITKDAIFSVLCIDFFTASFMYYIVDVNKQISFFHRKFYLLWRGLGTRNWKNFSRRMFYDSIKA